MFLWVLGSLASLSWKTFLYRIRIGKFNTGILALQVNNTTFIMSIRSVAPMITSPPTNAEVQSGVSTTFTCTANIGFPVQNITWTFTGAGKAAITLTGSQTGRTSTVTVTNAQPSNVGTYTCTATNAVASTTATATLEVNGKIIMHNISP